MTANGTIATGTTPPGICISADGTSVYVTNVTSNTVSIYTRNTSTGALTANGTISAGLGSGPRGICISADGTSVYVTNYYSNTVSIYTRNTSTGALTANGTIATGTTPPGICISPVGTSVYVTNYNSATVSIYTRNTSTGALTANGTIATGTNPYGICISADGTSVYVTNYTSSTVSIYNVVTGTMTVTNNSFTAPDSTSTAATLTANANNSITRQSVPTGLGQYTFSVYIYRKTGTGNVDITFDGNTFATQSITGAWVRYSITGYNANNPTMGIRIATSGDSVYVWGAQVEYNTTASTYEVITSQPAIWSKPNSTVALNQTGIDGVSNSASSLTATSTNATALQVVSTSAPAAYASSVYIKGLTVTGDIQVTLDGSTWSTVDLSNGLWNRIVLTGTLANPAIGVLITNSGDSVAMDYAQIEAGAFATSAILTTSATVTRSADLASLSSPSFSWFSQLNETSYASFIVSQASNAPILFGNSSNIGNLTVNTSSQGSQTNGTTAIATTNAITLGQLSKVAVTGTATRREIGLNGFATTYSPTTIRNNLVSNVYFGSNGSSYMNGWLNRVVYIPKGLTGFTVQDLTGQAT